MHSKIDQQGPGQFFNGLHVAGRSLFDVRACDFAQFFHVLAGAGCGSVALHWIIVHFIERGACHDAAHHKGLAHLPRCIPRPRHGNLPPKRNAV